MPDRPQAALGQPTERHAPPEVIIERILDALSTGGLKAGDKLPDEAQLARTFGAARLPLRNALIVLRDLGLVDTARGRFGGTFVAVDVHERLRNMAPEASIDAAALRSLTDWRRAITGEACFLAALRASDAQLAEIEAAAQGFVDEFPDIDARRAADARFHVTIAEATGSRHLVEQEEAIQQAFNAVYASLPIVRHAVGSASMDHTPLVRALLARDAARAREEAIAHIESTCAWCCSLLRVKMPG